MIITKAPFRISFFGGSSDYKNFYEKHGSFLIGTTIDKYVYSSLRFRPRIVSSTSIINYSKREEVSNLLDIKHPLVREIFKLYNVNQSIDLNTFSDIPQRTGLGGSSSFAVSILLAVYKKFKYDLNKNKLSLDAIKIEREILNEAGGIQDQIWASYGGFNSIEIKQSGEFFVRPLPVSSNFIEEFEQSLVLIYTLQQRDNDVIAKEHIEYDKTKILELSKQAYLEFQNENISEIGKLLILSWIEKKKISSNICTNQIENIISVLDSINGVYGYKLPGAGGGGFIVAICNQTAKNKLNEIFKDSILPIKIEKNGASCIHYQDE
jgi:D-glycero-alpha-D-manno-heptose-7-phosphate kinase